MEDGEGGESCCTMDPQCPTGAVQVASCGSADCFSVEACCTEILCEPEPECRGLPSCEGYEEQVDSCESSIECRPVSMCGVTIYCNAEEFCGAVPTCDPDDEEVPVCPLDASCYDVTMCGATITCFDHALQHGCPDSMPAEGQPCADPGHWCDYPLTDGCFESWNCQEDQLIWTFGGGGCTGRG